jgi:F-type H+-transporting ATPase subunit a
MEQFNIKPLVPLEIGGIDISFTNSSLFMVIAVVCAVLFLALSMRKASVIPGTAQSLAEMTYEFVGGIIQENIGAEGKKYFPLIFSIFMFVAFGNVLGLFPYSFTFTSHVSAVGTIALLALTINVIVGIKTHGLGWLHTFCPKGSPLIAIPILIPIEIFSFLSKPFSLTVRLAANMTVGHIMLKVIAGFVVMLGLAGGILPLFFDCLIIAFELGIGLLQAYIFTILSCVYLGDALHEH